MNPTDEVNIYSFKKILINLFPFLEVPRLFILVFSAGNGFTHGRIVLCLGLVVVVVYFFNNYLDCVKKNSC